jgi:phospholipid transport system substrate-binding protein
MKPMNTLKSVLLTLAFCISSGVALAGSAQSYLEAKQKELTTLIKQPAGADNDKKLRVTFDALLDYDALAKDSLGKLWDDRTEAERKEFQTLLTTLVQSAYTKNIRNTLDYNITFVGEQPAKAGELVQTVAKHKTDARKESIHIDYLLHDVGGKFRVYDIITEGSSLVKNYNSQFRGIVNKHGFAELLNRMRKKAQEA